jgi:hypothetical protein
VIDDLYDLIGGRQTVRAATESFYKRVFADETLRPFLKLAIWRSYALDRVCLSPCSSADGLSIRESISTPHFAVRGSKG